MAKAILNKSKNTVTTETFLELPIAPNTNLENFVDGQEVNTELVFIYVEPDESIHCNRGSDVKMAKILTDDDVLNKIKQNLCVIFDLESTDKSIDFLIDILTKKGYKIS